MEDNAIVELYFARSEQAIRETEQKYGAYLNTIATNILHLPEDAEETVSDTYLAAWNAIPPTRPRVLRHFLSRIVRNKAFQRYSYLTAAKRCAETDVLLSEIEDCLPDGRQDTTRRMEQRVITQSINAFLGSLSREEQGIFTARYFYAVPLDLNSRKIILHFQYSSESSIFLEKRREKCLTFSKAYSIIILYINRKQVLSWHWIKRYR